MKNKIYTYFFFFILLFSLSISSSWGQTDSSIEIVQVKVNKEMHRVELLLKAFHADNTDLFPLYEGTNSYNKQGLKAFVQPAEGGDMDSLKILSLELASDGLYQTEEVKSNPRILFLLDLSGSMRGEKLESAKLAIKTALESDALRGSITEFAWFHNRVSATRTVTLSTYPEIVSIVNVGPLKKGKDTDLYRAIDEKTAEYALFDGSKVIILLTDGENDIKRNPLYKGRNPLIPIQEEGLLATIRKRTAEDSLFQIFPIGIGAAPDKVFLEALKDATANLEDEYWYEIKPEEIAGTFQRILRDITQPNFVLSVLPSGNKNGRFGAGARTFMVNYTHPVTGAFTLDDINATLGSSAVEVDIYQNPSNYGLTILIGLALLGGLIAVLAFSIPIFNDKNFRTDYIKFYREVKLAGRPTIDPLSQETFDDNEQVVVNKSRDMIMSLTTWKYYREENKEANAGNYAELFPPQLTAKDFFTQRGVFKKLNWLWFGAFGGFLSWGVWAILQTVDWTFYETFLGVLDQENEQISTSVLEETIVGVAMGAGIIGALAWVEEKGQSRKFNLGRILGRILLGIVLAWFIFFIESAVVAKFVPFDFLKQLIGWLLFGTAMGWVLSFFSSIEPFNAIKGGFVAGIIAFMVYYGLNSPLLSGILATETTQLIGYITYGGILGYMIFTVVANLEDYELRCLSPSHFSGWQSPISKWLKSGKLDYILIGKHPKNRVYIKWDDPAVKHKHARLFLIKDIPYIESDEGDVLVNNKLITGSTELNNGDSIKLGKNSLSILQFVSQKAKTTNYQRRVDGRSTIVSSKGKGRSSREVKKIRSQITIKRKPKK